jgi:hypothetical protein
MEETRKKHRRWEIEKEMNIMAGGAHGAVTFALDKICVWL